MDTTTKMNETEVPPLTAKDVVAMMEKIRLIGKEEGGYFTREDVVTALEVLHRERAISFGA